jgi:hypothetical protein
MSRAYGSAESAYGWLAEDTVPVTAPGLTPAARDLTWRQAWAVTAGGATPGVREFVCTQPAGLAVTAVGATPAARTLTWAWTWPLARTGASSGARTTYLSDGGAFTVGLAGTPPMARAAAFLPHLPFVASRTSALSGARGATLLGHYPFLASPASITPAVRSVVFRAVLFVADAAGNSPAARPMALWPWVLLLMYLVAGELRDIGFDFRKHVDADDAIADLQWFVTGQAKLHGRGAVGTLAWVRVSDVPAGAHTDLTAHVRVSDGRVLRRTLRIMGVDVGVAS